MTCARYRLRAGRPRWYTTDLLVQPWHQRACAKKSFVCACVRSFHKELFSCSCYPVTHLFRFTEVCLGSLPHAQRHAVPAEVNAPLFLPPSTFTRLSVTQFYNNNNNNNNAIYIAQIRAQQQMWLGDYLYGYTWLPGLQSGELQLTDIRLEWELISDSLTMLIPIPGEYLLITVHHTSSIQVAASRIISKSYFANSICALLVACKFDPTLCPLSWFWWWLIP